MLLVQTLITLSPKSALEYHELSRDAFIGKKPSPSWNLHLAEMAALPLQTAGRISLSFTASSTLCSTSLSQHPEPKKLRGSGTAASQWWYVEHCHNLRINRAPPQGNRMVLSAPGTSGPAAHNKFATCSAASAQPLLSTLPPVGARFGLSGLKAHRWCTRLITRALHNSIQDSGNCLDLLHRCLIQSAVSRLSAIHV